MKRLLPVNWRTKAPGAGCPRSDSAARYSPAGHPSVRSTRSARSAAISSTPDTARTSAAACNGVKRSSGILISTISPMVRSRASGSRGSARVMSTTRTAGGK